MILNLIMVAAGLVILILAGDALVRGAVNLALRLGITPLVVSLTVVAFGTSAPELIIAIQAALEGAPGIAYGNVIGSNIANVFLVLGVPAALVAITPEAAKSRRSYMMMMLATAAFLVSCAFGGLTFWHGVGFLLFLSFILYDTVQGASADAAGEVEDLDTDITGTWIAIFLLLGLVGLPLGAELLIRGGVGIAAAFGMPEAVIGLTIVAIGTSLPELATTIAAAYRRQADVAIGNVIGSNIFNILSIMGVVSLFGALPVPPGIMMLDLLVMLAAALALIPFVYGAVSLTRPIGVAWVLGYAIYIAVIVGVNTGTT